jgi:translation initiation factor IF-3
MNCDYSKRDYLLPKGCKDLIDVGKLDAKVKALKQQTPIVIDLSTNVDVEAAMKRAEDLLREGEQIKLKLRFRGREMANTQSGFDLMKKALATLAPLGRPKAEPKLIGRFLFVIVCPLR